MLANAFNFMPKKVRSTFFWDTFILVSQCQDADIHEETAVRLN